MKVQQTTANRGYYDALFQSIMDYCDGLSASERELYNLTDLPKVENLRQYYERLDKLRSCGNYDFFRMPPEEGFFEIDLNTRKIAVPSKATSIDMTPSFAENGIGVQGDHSAEILYFKCDRYFDAMDLALCQPNADENAKVQGACWIQWKRPGDTVPHLTPAYNFDVNDESDEYYPDTIIFGWPLSSEATAVAGDLEFSVRFVQWDPEKNQYRNIPTELSYSLSTIPAKCSIKASLVEQINLADFEIEDTLNTEIEKRAIYSGIVTTGSGAAPTIVNNGDLAPTADLQDYETGEKGVHIFTISAYSPDRGTLSADWFQDIYGDTETSMRVTDSSLMSVETPESAGGIYKFNFTADKAGSYYAVLKNKSMKTDKEGNQFSFTRALQSNVSVIEAASDFTLIENIPGRAYSVEGAEFSVEAQGANGATAPQNGYNGVSYQWYIQRSLGAENEYALAAPVEGATEATWKPAVDTDGLIYCVVVNTRNKDRQEKRTMSTCELRAMPKAPIANIIAKNDRTYTIDLSNEPDTRDLNYKWVDLAVGREVSSSPDYAPWDDEAFKKYYKSGDKISVTCYVTRKIWSGTQLEETNTTTLSKDIIVP